MRASASRRLSPSLIANAAGVLAAGLLLAVPPLAHADRDDWDDDDRYRAYRGRHHGHHGHRVRRHRHEHDAGCDHDRGDYARYRPYQPYYAYRPYARPRAVVSHRYYCRPCDHWWDDRGDFYSHVHRRHAVPFLGIPFSLGEAAWGWIFLGG
jgi:hypothetical protein